MDETPGHSIDILLIEDNSGDISLAREAFRDTKVRNQLFVAEDGEEAMEFLHGRGRYAGMPRPDLILLDLNLPKLSGREILAEMKADESLRSIPVVVLTSSKAEEDILKCYDDHANCYISKPLDSNQFVRVIKSIEEFWLTIVKLPSKNGQSQMRSPGRC